MRSSIVRLLALPVPVVLVAFALSGPAGAAGDPAATVRAGVITTIAGGVGGPAPGTSVAVNQPCGVAFGHGKAYFTEAGLVRQLDPGTGALETLVGPDNTGLDALPAAAPDLPCGAAVDAAGNVVFADAGNDVVRVAAARTGTFYGVAMQAGHVYTVAGGGAAHGTPAQQASLESPDGVAVDRAGNLLVTSQTSTYVPGEVSVQGTAIVQVVAGATGTFYGQPMVAGGLYTIAADCPTFYCAPGFSGDGGPATAAAFGPSIPQLAVDAAGDVVLADAGNNRVRVIAVSTGTRYGQAMTAGDIYTIAGGGDGGLGDGGAATSATLSSPDGVAVAGNGNVMVSDPGDQRIRLVAVETGQFYGQPMTAGDIYTVAGNGTGRFAGDNGPADKAEVQAPSGAAIDGNGNLIFADTGNNRVRLVAEKTGVFYGRRMTANDIYTIGGNGSTTYSGNGVTATTAQLDPGGGNADLAVAGNGDVVVGDAGNNRVRVIAEKTGGFYGQKFTAGRIYTVAGTGTPGFSGDGGLGTKARLTDPIGVTTDGAGNILVSDAENGRVRVIADRSARFYGRAMTTGHIYTVAGGGNGTGNGITATKASLSPRGIAVDGNGNLLIVTSAAVRVVAVKSGRFYGKQMTSGDIYTVSALGGMVAVAVDHQGNLVVANGNDQVLVVATRTGRFYGQQMKDGDVYRVAGVPNQKGFYGVGIPALKAHLDDPVAVAVDAAGNLLIADAGNDRIRVVAERTGGFYGRAMTTGDIYVVAGGGNGTGEGPGYAGDGGRAIEATLSSPDGIEPYAAADAGLVILDGGDNRVRTVTG
jgi:trimeric autotransporter adhesin